MTDGIPDEMKEDIPVRHIKAGVSNADAAAAFGIRSLGEMLNGAAMHQDLHRHDFYLILVVEKGSGVHEIDFTAYDVTPLSVFVMRPGQVHKLSLSSDSSGYLLQFEPGFYQPENTDARQILRRVSSKNQCRIAAGRLKRVLGILEQLHDEHREKQEGFRQVILANLGNLMIELFRQRKNLHPEANTGSYRQEQLDKFLELLEANISNLKQVADYAQLMHLTPYQLGSLTKSALGKTPQELINGQVILEAKRQLLATSKQVSHIALDLGYDDPSYFIRFFKKHSGATPEAFRQNLR